MAQMDQLEPSRWRLQVAWPSPVPDPEALLTQGMFPLSSSLLFFFFSSLLSSSLFSGFPWWKVEEGAIKLSNKSAKLQAFVPNKPWAEFSVITTEELN